MPSIGPRTARSLLAAGALAAALTLTACEPQDDAEALPPAGSAPASTTAPAPAAPTTSAPAAGTPTATAKPTVKTSAKTSGKHTVVSAATAGGLAKSTGDGQITDVPVDPGEMRDGMNLVVENYDPATAAGGRRILFVGVDNVPEDPNKRREHLWRGMIEYAVGNGSTGDPTTADPYGPGPLGGSLECLTIGSDAICGWADSSTAGVALFPKSTPAAAARLFAAMRADLEK